MNTIEPLTVEKVCLCNAKKQERIDHSKKLKMKMRELMLREPAIQTTELASKTGFSEYQVLRKYLPLRRELFAREMK